MSNFPRLIRGWRPVIVLLLTAATVPAWAQSDQFRGPDGTRYWYSEGQWYRWGSGRWKETKPPVGLYVPSLPYYARVIPYQGTTYYYADQTYYVWNDGNRKFQVVAPPAGIPSASPPARMMPPPPPPSAAAAAPADERLFAYPANGQSAQQQQKDRTECSRWAADQSHYNPSAPSAADSAAQGAQMRDAYFRAEASCLEARGYAVR